MNLMTLLRLSGAVAFAWIAVALGAGVLGVGTRERHQATTFYIPRPSLHDAVPAGRPDGPDKMEYQLLDRKSGRIDPLRLPPGAAWSLLSVCPWRDPEGNLQAVGRWVCRRDGEDEFCGLGILRLTDMSVRARITLDLLPTGKPCWVPGHTGEILFPAGNGHLYRCNVGGLTGEIQAGESVAVDRRKSTPTAARVVTWESDQPGSGIVNLEDPAWSSEPAVSRFVFVALSMLDFRGNKRVILPSRIWCLEMNDDGDAIVAAGRLSQPGSEEQAGAGMFERMPNVVVGPGGKLSIVYLSRSMSENSWTLKSSPIEMDPATARPRVASNRGVTTVVARGLAPAALVVSADGESVFGIDAAGATVKHALPR